MCKSTCWTQWCSDASFEPFWSLAVCAIEEENLLRKQQVVQLQRFTEQCRQKFDAPVLFLLEDEGAVSPHVINGFWELGRWLFGGLGGGGGGGVEGERRRSN